MDDEEAEKHIHIHNKLSFVSLHISLSHSRSINVTDNGIIRTLGYGSLVAFHSNYGRILYRFCRAMRCISAAYVVM